MRNDTTTRTAEANGSRALVTEAIHKALEAFCYHGELAFDEAMASGLRFIAEALGAGSVALCRYAETGGGRRLARAYRWDKPGGGLAGKGIDLMPGNRAMEKWLGILLQDACVNKRLGDMPADEAAAMNASGVKSVLMVPVFARGEFWGSLVFQDLACERRFDEGCMDLVRTAARLYANAVMHAEMVREAADRDEFSRVIFDTAPVGMVMFDEHSRLVNCNETALAIYGIDKQYYRDHFFDLSPEYQPDGTKSADKFLDILKATLDGDSKVMEWMYQTPDGEPIPCEITMTRVRYKGKYIGLGYVYDQRRIKNMEKSIRMLETEARKIFFDALTGIYNRRYFDENIKRVIKNLSRSDSKLSLMMIDIDFFKNYNDTYGHKEGDNCLTAVAETLSKTVTRADDFVIRYGGEEFVAVLPNTDGKGACIVAEKMLKNVQACNIPHGKNEAAICVTVSIGVTSGDVSHTQDADDYVKRADEMMYKSKNDGRNRYSYGDLS